jgi:release factor glutamine methyltransferase
MRRRESIGAALGAVTRALSAEGFDEPRRRARRLVGAALGLSAADVFANPDRMISVGDGDRIVALLARVLAHEPLSRVLGEREFWGLRFALSADTLDPRPESETIVEAVLARLPSRNDALRLLDLGTGTGCLLLALLSELPDATGVGIDIAPGAVRTARRNAWMLGLSERARFAVGDWGRALGEEFDAIVANPPYIAAAAMATLPREVAAYDPRRALAGGADGLAAFRAISADLPRLLAPAGIFAAEIGQGQAEAVAEILAASMLAIQGIMPDLAGIPRCILAAKPTGSIAAARSENGWNAPRSRLG